MPNTPGSFIPKQHTTGTVAPKRAGRRIYIFSYVAYVLFFGTLLSVVGIFVLDRQATQQLTAYTLQLDEARQNVSANRLEEVRALDQRIKTAETVLNWHVAPSRIFETLENVILESVQLTDFSYMRETGGDATISFTGQTGTFDALLFQRDIVNRSPLLASADIVSVELGTETSEDTPEALTVIAFGFENQETVEHIGYQPRTNLDEQASSSFVGEETESVTDEDVDVSQLDAESNDITQ